MTLRFRLRRWLLPLIKRADAVCYRRSFAIEDAIRALQHEHAPAAAYTPARRQALCTLIDLRDLSAGFRSAWLDRENI